MYPSAARHATNALTPSSRPEDLEKIRKKKELIRKHEEEERAAIEAAIHAKTTEERLNDLRASLTTTEKRFVLIQQRKIDSGNSMYNKELEHLSKKIERLLEVLTTV